MKRFILSLTAVLAAVSFATAGNITDWTMQKEGSKVSYDVKVPCTVAGALNEAGAFGVNPLEQDRYFSID